MTAAGAGAGAAPARQALVALVPADAALGTSVIVLPDALKYTARHLDIYALAPEDTGDWLRHLVRLAGAAEAAGPPAERLAGGGGAGSLLRGQAGQLTARKQSNRRGLRPLLVGLGCGTVFVVVAMVLITVLCFLSLR